MAYDGSFENIRKSDSLNDVVEVINDKLNELIDEVNKSRIEGKEQIMNGLCAFCGAVACAGACVVTGGLAAGPILAYSALAGGADAKNEVDQQINANNQIQNQINDIIGKINGTIPRKPNETDEWLNTQLGILTGNLRNGESRLNDLRKTLDTLRKELGGGNSLLSFLGLNKLGFMEKVMVIGGIVVVIFLLKG
nr:15430_t:CDS:2 [Entrophospora candida]